MEKIQYRGSRPQDRGRGTRVRGLGSCLRDRGQDRGSRPQDRGRGTRVRGRGSCLRDRGQVRGSRPQDRWPRQQGSMLTNKLHVNSKLSLTRTRNGIQTFSYITRIHTHVARNFHISYFLTPTIVASV